MGFDNLGHASTNFSSNSHLGPEISKYFFINYICSYSWHDHLLFSLFLALYGHQFIETWNKLSKTKKYRKISFYFKLFAKTVNGIPLTIAMLPLFLPIYLILLLWTKAVEWRVRAKFGDSVKGGTGMDTVWGCGSDYDKPIITIAMKMEGKVEIEKVKKQLKNILFTKNEANEYPYWKFTQIFNNHCGIYLWRDADNFDFDNHVRTVNLHKLYATDTNDGIRERETQEILNCTEQLLCRYIGERSNEGIPPCMPQWEIIFLTNGNEREFTTLFRIHHAIGDGVALTRFLIEILADNPTKVSILGDPPHPVVRCLTFIWSLIILPFAATYIITKGRTNPLHGKKLTGRKIFVTSGEISLELVKKIKKKTKSTVTDILFSCLSYSLSSYFSKRGSDVPDIKMMFPIGFEDLSKPIALTNSFAIGLTNLPTPAESNHLPEDGIWTKGEYTALQRLQVVKEVLDFTKNDPTLSSLFWLTSCTASVMPAALNEYIFSAGGITMGVSNLPGPKNDLYIWNCLVTEMRFWVPDRAPTGTGFSFMSYKGAIRLGFSVDEGLINERKKAEDIIISFGQQLKRLAEEVQVE